MAWFRCSCGHLAEVIPRDGYEIASVYHMHTRARVAGGNGPMRMEKAPAPTPAPTPEPALAGAPSSCLVTRSRGDGTIRCWIPEPEPATGPGPRRAEIGLFLVERRSSPSRSDVRERGRRRVGSLAPQDSQQLRSTTSLPLVAGRS